jgi:hypothetical protein
MPKSKTKGWKRGEGAYSKSDDVKLRQIPHPGWETTDRSRTVDTNNDRSGGFSAKLTPPKE